MKDSFYTPTDLANRLTKFVNKRIVKNVADFCVGDGELLRAAVLKWPNIKCSGTDISQKTISSVKKSHPDWELSKCDFLKEKARNRSKILKKSGGYDLILLNPPFSCIGGSRHKFQFEGEIYESSTAMYFFTESIKYLAKNGSIYAILPTSVAYSQKDERLWKVLVEKYRLRILEESNTKHFTDCSARIIMVSINANFHKGNPPELRSFSNKNKDLSIFRGKIGMHTLNPESDKGIFLVHSTNLRNNRIEGLRYRNQNKLSLISGPAVLLPRVGNPNKQKICILSEKQSYVLSDCILAIKTKTDLDSNNLKSIFMANWEEVNALYKGTGARYITVKRLEQFLGLKNDKNPNDKN